MNFWLMHFVLIFFNAMYPDHPPHYYISGSLLNFTLSLFLIFILCFFSVFLDENDGCSLFNVTIVDNSMDVVYNSGINSIIILLLFNFTLYFQTIFYFLDQSDFLFNETFFSFLFRPVSSFQNPLVRIHKPECEFFFLLNFPFLIVVFF